ncbi:hypothetical protein ACFYYR_15075 [Streptomyces sp. NPDC001922]|uniref:hypothetical protein n=1 Tax=Streptomyces sp. NPDC001922 TaxID=3364624 RepID=UPI00367C7D4D
MESAEHLPGDFLRSLKARPLAYDGQSWADGHAYVQSNLMQPAVATASMVMAALAGGVPPEHRRELMMVLGSLTAGEQDDIADLCRDVVRGGTWLLYEEVTSGRDIDAATYAFWMLEEVEEDVERIGFLRNSARENLPSDLN